MTDDEDDKVIVIDSPRSRSFGTWETESESAAEFDRRIERCGLFARMFPEVDGHYMAYRPNRNGRNARIDRVLLPGKRLIDAGWTATIGVEIKRSGEKIGPSLAQAIDYTWCNWNVGHYWMWCEHIFLWPFEKQFHATESVLAQNGVGVVYESQSASLIFRLDQEVIVANLDGTMRVAKSRAGRKVGSR